MARIINSDILKHIPLIRIILPMIIGIVLWDIHLSTLISIVALSIIIATILYLFIIKKNNKIISRYYSIILFIFITTLTHIYCNVNNQKPSNPNDNDFILARIEESKIKEASTSIISTIIAYENDGKISYDIDKQKVQLSISSFEYDLIPGKVIKIKPNFVEVSNLGNPDEFDYKRYMNLKGIYYSQFTTRQGYVIVGEYNTLFTSARNCQERLIKSIINCDVINPDAQDFLIAVLLGNRSFIDDNINNAFANIGVAHILAVSGLHIGIISLILLFILYPLDYIGMKRLRMIITIIILITYAAITGFSPSAIRATLLCTITTIAIILNRKQNIINTLCATAILILMFDPASLFDIGFQLSFISVLFIIIFTKMLNNIKFRNPIINWTAGLIIISMSAMAGTGIISAYYFNSLPILFLIPNIIIVPILPYIISVGILSLLSNNYFFGNLYNSGYDFIIWITNILSRNSISHIDNIYISGADVTIYFVLLFIGIIAIIRKKYKHIILVILIATVYISTITIKRSVTQYEPQMIVFNEFKETPIAIVKNNEITFINNITEEYISQFNNNHKKFIAKRNINNISCIDRSSSVLSFKGKNIIIAGKRSNLPSIYEDCDILIITDKFYGNIEKLIKSYKPSIIVLSRSIYYKRRNKMIAEINKLGVKYYDAALNKAFTL